MLGIDSIETVIRRTVAQQQHQISLAAVGRDDCET